MIDRRQFIKSSLGVIATGMAMQTFGCRSTPPNKKRRLEKIGVQLYSIRAKMNDDFEGALAKVAEIGYKEVEFAGYFDRQPEEVSKLLKGLGLQAPATHVPLAMVTNQMEQLITVAKTIGHRYIVCPWVDKNQYQTIDAWKGLAESFNKAGEACKAAGLRFAYHNHAFEFEATEDKLPMDILLEETDDELVDFEFDLYWVKVGGQDPVDYFNRFPGRFKLWHVKDMATDEKMVDVGKGIIDFSRIFAQSEKAGVRHYFVEHDNPEDPFASIEASFRRLEQLEF